MLQKAHIKKWIQGLFKYAHQQVEIDIDIDIDK